MKRLPRQAYEWGNAIRHYGYSSWRLEHLPPLERIRCAWLCSCAVLHVHERNWTTDVGPRVALNTTHRWLEGQRVSIVDLNEAVNLAEESAARHAHVAASAAAAAGATVRAIFQFSISWETASFISDAIRFAIRAARPHPSPFAYNIVHAVTREHRARQWTARFVRAASRHGVRIDRAAPDLDDQCAVALDVLEEAGMAYPTLAA